MRRELSKLDICFMTTTFLSLLILASFILNAVCKGHEMYEETIEPYFRYGMIPISLILNICVFVFFTTSNHDSSIEYGPTKADKEILLEKDQTGIINKLNTHPTPIPNYKQSSSFSTSPYELSHAKSRQTHIRENEESILFPQ